MINNEYDIYEHLKLDDLIHIVAFYESFEDLKNVDAISKKFNKFF
jgi:hypothetical protein